MRFGGFLLSIVLALSLLACNTTTSTTQYALSTPTSLAIVCLSWGDDGLESIPVGQCSEADGDQVLAFAANGPTGDVGIINLTTGQPVDTDVMVPGYTRLDTGGYVTDLVAIPNGGQLVAVDPTSSRLVFVSPIGLEMKPVDLELRPERVLVSEDSGFIVVTFPDNGQIGRAELDSEYNPGEFTMVTLPGTPLSVEWVGAERLAVSFRDSVQIVILSAETLEVEQTLALVPACMDGLDNDGDALVDSADAGCSNPFDNNEGDDPVLCGPDDDPAETGCTDGAALSECANGVDDDGDGLVDLVDTGCSSRSDNSEATDSPQCADGLDNDGDGKTDSEEDDDCSGPDGAFETRPDTTEFLYDPCDDGYDNDSDGLIDLDDPQCKATGVTEVSAFPCSDQVDNDGDGLVDYPEDPDCFAAGARVEAPFPSAMARLSSSPDGKFIYAIYSGTSSISVIDIENGVLVDVDSITESIDRRIRRSDESWGIEFSNTPTDVVFHETDDGLFAYVTDQGGLVSKVRVTRDGQQLHQIEESPLVEGETRETSSAKPRLYVDDVEVQLGYSPPMGHPNLGSLRVESSPDKPTVYYGIQFTADSQRAQRGETWSVEYEGALPGSSSSQAQYRGDLVVDVPLANLCALGALPGDLLCLWTPANSACDQFAPSTEYCFTASEVHADRVVLEAGSGHRWIEGEGAESAEDPTTDCFFGLLTMKIRANKGFVVTGSRTGFLHDVVQTAQGCAVRDGADPLYNGRIPYEFDDSVAPLSCPVSSETGGVDSMPFANPLLSFNVYPGCDVQTDGRWAWVPPSRGTRWTFGVTSGFMAEIIQGGLMPIDAQISPELGRLWVLDSAGRSVKSIDLDSFTLMSGYY